MIKQISRISWILIAFSLLSGCAPTSATPAATFSASSFEEIKPIAETFVDQMSKGSYTDAAKLFDPELNNASLETGLKKSWEDLTDQVGVFQQQNGVRTDTVQGLRAVLVTCQFEKDAVDVRIFFNAENEIRGMNFAQARRPQ